MKNSEYKRIDGAMGPVKYVEVGRVYKVERNNLPLVMAVLIDTASVFTRQEIVHTFLNSRGEVFTCNDTDISLSEGKFNHDVHIKVFQIFNAMIQKQRHERIARSLENEIAQIKVELAMENCYQCHGTGNSKASANVVLRSTEPLKKAPEISSIGGFAVGTEENQIRFDWLSSRGYTGFDVEDHLIIEWELGGFDVEFYKESNPDKPFPLWEELVKLPLYEVFYEAGDDEDPQRIWMELVSFSVVYENENGVEVHVEFTQKQIEDYNKREGRT